MRPFHLLLFLALFLLQAWLATPATVSAPTWGGFGFRFLPSAPSPGPDAPPPVRQGPLARLSGYLRGLVPSAWSSQPAASSANRRPASLSIGSSVSATPSLSPSTRSSVSPPVTPSSARHSDSGAESSQQHARKQSGSNLFEDDPEDPIEEARRKGRITLTEPLMKERVLLLDQISALGSIKNAAVLRQRANNLALTIQRPPTSLAFRFAAQYVALASMYPQHGTVYLEYAKQYLNWFPSKKSVPWPLPSGMYHVYKDPIRMWQNTLYNEGHEDELGAFRQAIETDPWIAGGGLDGQGKTLGV